MPHFLVSLTRSPQVKSMQKRLKKQGYFRDVIYLFEPNSIEILRKNLQPGDTLVVFAEGLPWVIAGNDFNSQQALNPFEFAQLMSTLVSKSMELTIELRACNSATIARGRNGDICYAKDVSEDLSRLGFNGIVVRGYTGYVQVENPFKPSVVEWYGDSGSKMRHCRYQDAQAEYKNGKLITPPSKTIVKNYNYTDDNLASSSLMNYFKAKKRVLLQNAKVAQLRDQSLTDSSFSEDAQVSLLFSQLRFSPPSSPKESKERNIEDKKAFIPRGGSPRKKRKHVSMRG